MVPLNTGDEIMPRICDWEIIWNGNHLSFTKIWQLFMFCLFPQKKSNVYLSQTLGMIYQNTSISLGVRRCLFPRLFGIRQLKYLCIQAHSIHVWYIFKIPLFTLKQQPSMYRYVFSWNLMGRIRWSEQFSGGNERTTGECAWYYWLLRCRWQHHEGRGGLQQGPSWDPLGQVTGCEPPKKYRLHDFGGGVQHVWVSRV